MACPEERGPRCREARRRRQPGRGGRRQATAGAATRAIATLALQEAMPRAVQAVLLTGRVTERVTEAGEVQRGVVKHFWPAFGVEGPQPKGARPPWGPRRSSSAALGSAGVNAGTWPP